MWTSTSLVPDVIPTALLREIYGAQGVIANTNMVLDEPIQYEHDGLRFRAWVDDEDFAVVKSNNGNGDEVNIRLEGELREDDAGRWWIKTKAHR